MGPEVSQIQFLLGRKYRKAFPVWSASDCLSQICPKVSHSRPKNGLDRYPTQADTAGYPAIQTTINWEIFVLQNFCRLNSRVVEFL